MEQNVLLGTTGYKAMMDNIVKKGIKRIFLVHGSNSYNKLNISQVIETFRLETSHFTSFSSNPTYESIVEGTNMFNNNACSAILAVGGGSAIDVAKCIKYYSSISNDIYSLPKNAKKNDILLCAIPTTAGTGSEATNFAVMYKNGEKKSICHTSLLPNIVILDSNNLVSLPLYQKKVTMMDALCQAIESWWSKRASKVSIEYSQKAIKLIIDNVQSYLDGDVNASMQILLAANYSGKAINITTTTAVHAMSYKLSSICNIPHGHAVALCMPHVWDYMIENCSDNKLNNKFTDIAIALGQYSPDAASEWLKSFNKEMNLNIDNKISETDIKLLVKSVNIERLSNNPMGFNEDVLNLLYRKILKHN